MLLDRDLFFLALITGVVSSLGKNVEPECEVDDYSQLKIALVDCAEIIINDIEVPGGETLDLNLENVSVVTFNGTVTFGHTEWSGPLVTVRGNNVKVQGNPGHVLDGQGPLYWDGKGGMGTVKPYFFAIEANNSHFDNINLLNCPHHCTTINATGVTLSKWNIDCSEGDPGVAPEGKEGHNTDGFDVLDSENLIIKDSVVKNQDDCVAINKGNNMQISGLHCSGCHGLSLSVGFSKTSLEGNMVTNVMFSDSVVVDSGTAIHIKTHNDGGPGLIDNIIYKNISFQGITDYGIKIQQDYANGGSTGIPIGNIPITNLSLDGVRGSVTGNKSTGVVILCAEDACTNFDWRNVSITGGHASDNCTYIPHGYNC